MGTTVTIIDENVHLIDSTASGPLGYGLSALLIGRSSATKMGIFVLPGLIDADYIGIIKIMVKIFSPPVTITKGSKIAQLIPFKSQVPVAAMKDRGTGAFGSTTNNQPLVLFSTLISNERPLRKVIIEHSGETLGNEPCSMMLDTGADVTIIPYHAWPAHWPLRSVAIAVTGVGGNAQTRQSTNLICFRDAEENQVAWTRPYVMCTSLWILGRDILSQWGITLQTSGMPPLK